MNLIIQLFVVFLLVITSACAPIEVKTDYAPTANFDKLKRYKWIPNEQPDLVEIKVDKALMDKAVHDTVIDKLNSKGYAVSEDNPDFLVVYYVVINAKTDVYFVQQYFDGIGLTPQSSRTTAAQEHRKIRDVTYEQGILIIDVLDSGSKERIWRGYAQSRAGIYDNTDRQIERIKTAVKKILNRFPP